VIATPRVVFVTATDVVPEAALFARLRAAEGLPAVARGRLAVQLRDPELSGGELFRLGRRLREETARLGASLVVNDRLDLALALGADGVHLGRRSVRPQEARALLGAEGWISVSCHAAGEVVDAAEGADAVLLSPIFASPGKGTPLGPGALAEARRALDAAGLGATALLALGGIDAEGAAACFRAGAEGVALIRADLGASLAACLAPGA
jgi:thiamine-phosphate pyrophosphorylase